MSDADGTCEYVLDPDDPETWGGEEGEKCYVDEELLNEDGLWTCPHTAADSENRCVFHQSKENKNSDLVAEKFTSIISNAQDTSEGDIDLEFVGMIANKMSIDDIHIPELDSDIVVHMQHSTMDLLDLSGLNIKNLYIIKLSATRAMNIDLSDGLFKNGFTGVAIDCDRLNLSKSTFQSKCTFTSVTCSERLDADDAIFNSYVNFGGCEFDGYVYFDDTRFHAFARFVLAEFQQPVEFLGTVFDEGASFKEATFNGVQFGRRSGTERGKFNGVIHFNDAKFKETCRIFVDFKDNVTFEEAVFESYLAFSNGINGIQFKGDAVFSKVRVDDEATFAGVEFTGKTSFTGADLTNANFGGADLEAASFNNSQIQNSRFWRANLTGANFNGANCSRCDFESALLSRATLFGTDLRAAKISGAIIGDVRVDEDTRFLGRPSDDGDSSPHTFSAIRSQPTCVYDPDYEEDNEHEDVDKAKSVYRALEELGSKHARPRLQARSFVRRQDLQKKDYWDDAKETESWEERLIAGARWSRAKMARATLLYGESPWRVIAWSLGIIFSFALLYPLGGWMKPADGDPITYAQIASNPVEILNSVYYSTLTYTALGFGDFQPVGLGRLLTTLETGLGAVMLALLVFILGRRAAR